jgi:uncharacterized protein YbaP (TraB family)
MLVLFLFGLNACGSSTRAPQTPPPAEVTAPKPAPGDPSAAGAPAHKSFLWEVTQGTAKVYLLGSIHVAKQEIYPLAPAIEQAYESSDTLVLEVYLTKEVEAQVALKSARLGLYPAGDSVDKHLSPETWTRYFQFLQTEGKPLAVFTRMKPWLASVALMVEVLDQSGFEASHGIDRHFQERAEKDRKRIDSLETVDDQLSTLAGIDDPTQELMLLEFLDSKGEMGDQMKEAFGAWQTGDSEALEEILLSSMMQPAYQPVFEKLFVERNVRMKAKVSEYLAGRGTYFVVVGSGHLVGKQGIVELLRRDQHRVEQL